MFIITLGLLTHTPVPAPKCTVNLDDPPESRWIGCIDQQIATHGWNNTYAPVFRFIDEVVPKSMWFQHDELLTNVALPIVGEEMAAEVRGVFKHIQSIQGKNATTLSELLFFQIFYEILMQCTGLLAHPASGGGVLHGRNMDIGLLVENITAQVSWVKGGEEVLTTTQFLGYAGVHTGMRPRGWSVQANERVVLVDGGDGMSTEQATLLKTAEAFASGASPVGRFLRETLLAASSIHAAIPLLEKRQLASPMYLIIGDASGGGTVLTRDRTGPAQTPMDTSLLGFNLPPPTPRVSMDEPYLVQTNWDPWVSKTRQQCTWQVGNFSRLQAKACDGYVKDLYRPDSKPGACSLLCQLYSDGRKEAANAMMKNLASSDVDVEHMLRLLSTPPVLQGPGTKFTSVMRASSGEYHTWIQGFTAETPAASDRARTRVDNMVSTATKARVRFLIRRMSGIDDL